MFKKFCPLWHFVLLMALLLQATPSQASNLVRCQYMGCSKGIEVSKLTYRSGALLVKARLYLPPNEGRPLPVVIFSHDGNSGISRQHHISCLRLAGWGYAVIAPSYRGEDGSQGKVEIAKGEVDDVLNLWPVMSELTQLDANNVTLMGASHGALISLLAASRQPQIKGVIFAYGVADIYSWWHYITDDGKRLGDKLTRDTYGAGPLDRPQSFALRCGLDAVPRLQAPLLILQGELDTITPPDQALALKEKCDQCGKECELYLFPHALHGFLVYAPYLVKDVTPEEKAETEIAWQKVREFLGQSLGK